MRVVVIVILAVSALSVSFAPSNKDWYKLLADNQLQFTKPEDYKPVAVKKNRDQYYNYALKHKKQDLELRYSIMPLAAMVAEYKKGDGKMGVDPNTLYSTMLKVNVMNVSQQPEYFNGSGGMPQTDEFPKEAVKLEFNADAGATAAFPISENSQYGAGYKWGTMFVIHKHNVADVTICFLSSDKELLQQNFMQVFYALKFLAK